MVKVSGTGGAGGARGPRGVSSAKPTSGAFRPDGAGDVSPPAAALSETAAPSALGALIALQSEGRNSSKNRAMAERALMLLERVRDGLLTGRIAVADGGKIIAQDAPELRSERPGIDIADSLGRIVQQWLGLGRFEEIVDCDVGRGNLAFRFRFARWKPIGRALPDLERRLRIAHPVARHGTWDGPSKALRRNPGCASCAPRACTRRIPWGDRPSPST